MRPPRLQNVPGREVGFAGCPNPKVADFAPALKTLVVAREGGTITQERAIPMSIQNSVSLTGNLGADPDIRHTQSGDPIANLSIATSERWKDKNTGEKKEKTEWHRVVIFNKHLAKIAEEYLSKGSKVQIRGSLQTRKWTDQSGADKYTTEVILTAFDGDLLMLDGKKGEGRQPEPPAHSDDDIPFG